METSMGFNHVFTWSIYFLFVVLMPRIFFALFLHSLVFFSTWALRPFWANQCFGSCFIASSMLSYIIPKPLENGAFVWKPYMNIVCVSETLNFLASSCFNSGLDRLPLLGWITCIWNCLLRRWRSSWRCRMQTVWLGSTIANLIGKFLFQRSLSVITWQPMKEHIKFICIMNIFLKD